uniref:Uncharacterized protein n=1 Tax=Pararge aegeria TaxID=116150 RepID=S4P7W6_9NEOP
MSDSYQLKPPRWPLLTTIGKPRDLQCHPCATPKKLIPRETVPRPFVPGGHGNMPQQVAIVPGVELRYIIGLQKALNTAVGSGSAEF